ncbi:MAG: nucleotide exchange factor GrpE [Lachnospiraceae bacterium]|nr:nucleotide exchange factor GrpE [Lachnospiraceae bacterium]
MNEANKNSEANIIDKDSAASKEATDFVPPVMTADEKAAEAQGSGSGDGDTEKKANKRKPRQDKQKERIAELEDRVMRQMAEFENYRRRTEKEKMQMFETGSRSVIEKILPVVDNFERGLAAVTVAEKDTSFAEGMNMIYRQLMTEFEKMNVQPIPAVGCEFDPDLHNAVMQVESKEHESGTVVEEMQKGYKYRDTVVRHSMVSVAQ